MNEDERKSGQPGLDCATLGDSPHKTVDSSCSPIKELEISNSPRKTIETSAVEISSQRIIASSVSIAADGLTQRSDNLTLKHFENPKSVEDTPKKYFDDPSLKTIVTRKILEYSKLPGLVDKDLQPPIEARLKGDALLKSLLSASTAYTQKMITTTEVTDETLNLRKILYQPDKAKFDEKEHDLPLPSGNNANDHQIDEDDRRLVIDIPDEMSYKVNGKSMPSLESFEDENKNVSKILRPSTCDTAFVSTRPLMREPMAAQDKQLPTLITYSLGSSPVGGLSNSFKIDILTPVLSQTDSSAMTDKFLSVGNLQSPKGSSLSPPDEMNVISHEIDKQIIKKTNEILELLKEFVSGSVDKASFSVKMCEVGDLSAADLLSVAKKLIKRHKFEINPNQREFLRMKFLQFPTTSKDIVNYFENLLPQLNREKFISLIKFYEIIVKEMLNLNKTKILQYLIDFMVVRKNAQLDLLNFNYQVAYAPAVLPNNTPRTIPASKLQLPDSTQNPSERRNVKDDTSYNFIIRSDPIYLQAGSSFATNNRDVITCRMIPRVQLRNFELRPFDNNILRGRRLGRRMVRSNEEEKLQSDFLRTRMHFVSSNEPATPTNQLRIARSPIVVESDTPPPSLTSDPPSPLQRIVSRDRHEVPIVQIGNLDEVHRADVEESIPETSVNFMTRHPQKRGTENPIEMAKNVQISMHDIETLNQNGTEIIPTSIMKNSIIYRAPVEHVEDPIQAMEKCLPRGTSHDDSRPTLQARRPMPKRRQSCHERIVTKDNEEKIIEASVIGQNYMEFLDMYENMREQDEQKKEREQQRAQVQYHQVAVSTVLQVPPKRVRFSNDHERIPRTILETQVHFAQQQQMQQQIQNHQRIVQFPTSPLASALKSHAPSINYQYYQYQFERELRERGFDHRIENQIDPNRPLELVSTIPPERYHQHEQQRIHYANHGPPKPRPQEKPVQRVPPRNAHEEATQAAMMAAAYNQLQSLHRDPQTLTPQQYAEHLKQIDHLKRAQPSAFTAYQRNMALGEESAQRLALAEFYKNSQEIRQMPTNESPTQYQISSSSSREDSPNGYEMAHQDQSLQRKLKFKSKSAKYVEPSLLSKPFYNPPHSTYYSEPFALTKNKLVPTTSPPASMVYHTPEQMLSPSPNQRVAMDSKHYQWLVAHAHGQHIAAMHSQPPQRPIPRPPVPAFIDTKANGTVQHHPIQFEQPPTDFLRKYYASNANFKHI